MKYLASIVGALPSAFSLALRITTPDCTSFATSVDLSEYNGAVLNATYHPAQTVNVSTTFNSIPFCQIYGSISYGPSNNSSLTFALWLPEASNYNNRFLAVGNGGMAGVIDELNMLNQLNSRLGFAVAGGDTGHLASENNDGAGAPGVYLPYLHDESQVRAWIHDAISLFTPAAKALTEAYYGNIPKRSYYNGCSTGGAQGYALAQYHPHLFDGISAGSPGNWYSHLALSFLWNAQHTNSSQTNLTQAVLNFTTAAVLAACDELDGVADGLIENPLACPFTIDSLACAPSQQPVSADGKIQCLIPSQLSGAKAIYTGPVNSKTGEQLYPGFSLGSEISWLLQEGPLAEAFSIPILQNLVYDHLAYNADTFNWASDISDVDRNAGRLIDEISPDLSAFRDCGGKLITTQGWADPYNAATWPTEHLAQIEAEMGGDVSDFLKVFMVPGGGHCGSAEYYPQAPGTWHTMEPLVRWVERCVKPRSLKATDPEDGSGRTRRLCNWPRTARFVGGDSDDWESYVCA